jgi:hypothetical protein
MFDDDKREHCFFAVLNKDTGHCIAYCQKRNLVSPGITQDCIGKTSETIEEHIKRMASESKLT